MTPESPSHDRDEVVTITGLAQRAGAILHRMEQCSPPSLLHHKKQQQQQEQFKTPIDLESIIDSRKEIGQQSTSTYQNVYPNYPKHLSHTKFELPLPTDRIYNMVLKAYAKEGGDAHVSQQAEDVVWGMIVRATQQMKLQQQQQQQRIESAEVDKEDENKMMSTGRLQQDSVVLLYPTLENWNCVLKCWSKSTNTDRAFHAYAFLLSWMEWNNHSDGKGQHAIVHNPDVKSFHLVLQSCLVSGVVEDEGTSSTDGNTEMQRTKEMGSGVAIRLWKDFSYLTEDKLDSTTYHMIIRAICQTADLPSTKSNKALVALARVFTKCCEDGMDTPEIVEMVKAATTKPQFAQLESKARGLTKQ